MARGVGRGAGEEDGETRRHGDAESSGQRFSILTFGFLSQKRAVSNQFATATRTGRAAADFPPDGAKSGHHGDTVDTEKIGEIKALQLLGGFVCRKPSDQRSAVSKTRPDRVFAALNAEC